MATTSRTGGLRGALTLALMRIAAPVAGRVPRPFYALAWLAGWLAWRLHRNARRQTIRNLLPACDGDRGRARQASLQSFRNVARYFVDLATLRYRDHASFEHDHVHIVGAEHIPCLFATRPTIIASAHTGNPELALIAIAQRGRSWVELVEALAPPALGRYLTDLREAAGGRVVEVGVAGTRAALRELRGDGMVALLADRDLGGGGVCVTLVGRPVRLPRGPWELARRTGATVVPLFLARGFADDVTVHIDEPFTVPATADRETDVRRAAQRWADLLGAHLRRDPGQWTVLEDYWRVHACG